MQSQPDPEMSFNVPTLAWRVSALETSVSNLYKAVEDFKKLHLATAASIIGLLLACLGFMISQSHLMRDYSEVTPAQGSPHYVRSNP